MNKKESMDKIRSWWSKARKRCRQACSLAPEKSEWNAFYQAFELRFRGSAELLQQKLASRYGQLLSEQCQRFRQESPPAALDLGCGHGEFLEVLKTAGYRTCGVDQSSAATNLCRKNGHEVHTGDLLAVLQQQKSSDFSVVSLMHVVEHCPPPFILEVLREAYRVLQPGGLLIVETPSLYSLFASQRQFYLDPTHSHPVHPEYLEFMAQYLGFGRVQLLSYGEVEHPVRGQTPLDPEQLQRLGLQSLQNWEQWFFGAMDLTCLAYR